MEGLSVVTLKQAQAFYWTATLGTLARAAERLNLAQSTLSKRLAELETSLGVALFERHSRAMKTTAVGQALLVPAAELLSTEARFREGAMGTRAFGGPFRFGVTELVALTWLPRLIVTLRERYPDVLPEPEIDSNEILFEKLVDGRLDLAVGLNPPVDAGLEIVALDAIALQWVCAPGIEAREMVSVRELARHPVLMQSQSSGLHQALVEWLHGSGCSFNQIVTCNALHVLKLLAVAGLGITMMAEQYARPEVEAGRLRVITTAPPLPDLRYFVVTRKRTTDEFTARARGLVQACCNFDSP